MQKTQTRMRSRVLSTTKTALDDAECVGMLSYEFHRRVTAPHNWSHPKLSLILTEIAPKVSHQYPQQTHLACDFQMDDMYGAVYFVMTGWIFVHC